MERQRVPWVKEEGENACQVGDADGWMGLRTGYSREGNCYQLQRSHCPFLAKSLLMRTGA